MRFSDYCCKKRTFPVLFRKLLDYCSNRHELHIIVFSSNRLCHLFINYLKLHYDSLIRCNLREELLSSSWNSGPSHLVFILCFFNPFTVAEWSQFSDFFDLNKLQKILSEICFFLKNIFFVILFCVSYVTLMPNMANLSGIRTFRVLRALRTISTLRGMFYE